MLEEYRKHVAERAALGIVPKPLDATQMAALVELLKTPPVGEEEFLLDLLINRVPHGVDEAAYVKSGLSRCRRERRHYLPAGYSRKSH